jgi:hypothetical protein
MKEWFVALVPLASAALGAFLVYLFTSRAKRDESIIRFKEEKYAKLLVKLQGFVGTTTSGQLKREFFEEQYQSWLYASDEVIEALNILVRLVIESRGFTPDPEAGRRAVGEIVLAMRRDLLRKTNLDYTAFQYIDVHETKEEGEAVMSEDHEHLAEDASTKGDRTQVPRTPSQDGLWNQLGNAVALVAKQDQIVWAIFGVFWAADAVLLVALFTDGKPPERPVGLIVSFVGLAFSLVWWAIQNRAMAWLRFYETVARTLEETYLHIPLSVALTGRGNQVGGMRVRLLMLGCPIVSAVLWGWSVWWFFFAHT